MTQNKRVIAVTGHIGSGKSTVCKTLGQYGTVLSCDRINAEMLQDERYLAKLQDAFPFAFEEGKFNKQKFSHAVFSDENVRKKLNELAHPEILKRIFEKINESADELIFVEVPLLSGTPFESFFSEVVVVTAPWETRKKRVMARDSVTEAEAERKLLTQTAPLVFPQAKTYVIENVDLEKTQKDCAQLIEKLVEK